MLTRNMIPNFGIHASFVCFYVFYVPKWMFLDALGTYFLGIISIPIWSLHLLESMCIWKNILALVNVFVDCKAFITKCQIWFTLSILFDFLVVEIRDVNSMEVLILKDFFVYIINTSFILSQFYGVATWKCPTVTFKLNVMIFCVGASDMY